MLFLRLKVPDLINRPAGFAVCDFVFVQEPPIAKVYADGCGLEGTKFEQFIKWINTTSWISWAILSLNRIFDQLC